METEQIWANQLRFFRETAPRSGVPAGPVYQMPAGPSAVARRIDTWGGRMDVWRHTVSLVAIHQHYEGRFAFTPSLDLILWFLGEHATVTESDPVDSLYFVTGALTPDATGQLFVANVEDGRPHLSSDGNLSLPTDSRYVRTWHDGDRWRVDIFPGGTTGPFSSWQADPGVELSPELASGWAPDPASEVEAEGIPGFIVTPQPADVSAWRLDRNSPAPTFCLEVETQNGDRFRFVGMAFNELQVTVEPQRPITLELAALILDRQPMTDPLTDVTATISGRIAPSFDAGFAWSASTWGADPRIDDFQRCFAASLVMTRRDLDVAGFDPDGRPTRFTSTPWRVMADIRLPDCDLARAAKTRASGRIALFLGPDGQDIGLTVNSVSGFNDADAVKSADFREESVIFEAQGDPFGSLLEIRDNRP